MTSRVDDHLTFSSNKCHPKCIKNTSKKISINNHKFCVDYETLLFVFMRTNRCKDCVESVVQKLHLSFESMKKLNFDVWFMPLSYGRKDVLELLLMYGAERYKEYSSCVWTDSYHCLYSVYKFSIMNINVFMNIFYLFRDAGIPVDEEVVECVDRIRNREESTNIQTEMDLVGTLLMKREDN